MSASQPEVCDYEGSPYRAAFWGEGQRAYEDQVERVALRRLLPPSGRRALEIGAGFGRLTDELAAFEQVVLLDYSRSMLREARARLGVLPRYRYVAANAYQLPFAPGAFDGATMIRVIHHMADAPAALRQVRAALADGAAFVLEFASKRHIKSVLRYLLRRQGWNPFAREPVAFVPLNYDFHPAYIRDALRESGFAVKRQLTVSHFRLELIKRLVPTALLVKLDSLAQLTGNWWQYTPSVFVGAQASGAPAPLNPALFKCPACGCLEVDETESGVNCPACRRRYPVRDGIYDFKEPDLSASEGGIN